jgi:hypothetical protein
MSVYHTLTMVLAALLFTCAANAREKVEIATEA